MVIFNLQKILFSKKYFIPNFDKGYFTAAILLTFPEHKAWHFILIASYILYKKQIKK